LAAKLLIFVQRVGPFGLEVVDGVETLLLDSGLEEELVLGVVDVIVFVAADDTNSFLTVVRVPDGKEGVKVEGTIDVESPSFPPNSPLGVGTGNAWENIGGPEDVESESNFSSGVAPKARMLNVSRAFLATIITCIISFSSC